MEAIERIHTFDYYAVMAIVILVSAFPVISFIGHLTTEEGRKSLLDTPWLIIYFIIFIPFAWLFWFEMELLRSYLHTSIFWTQVIYIVLCMTPILDSEAIK